MTDVYFVRHGPTHAKVFTGWRDAPADLSDTAALNRLERALPEHAWVISSDLSRAVETAEAIQGNRQRLPNSKALREFDFGAWDGRDFTEVFEEDETRARAFWETPGDVAPPGGESWNALSQRVEREVRRLVTQASQAKPSPALVIVAHIGVILTQLARAYPRTPSEMLAQKIDPLSYSHIAFTGDGRNVRIVNRSA